MFYFGSSHNRTDGNEVTSSDDDDDDDDNGPSRYPEIAEDLIINPRVQ